VNILTTPNNIINTIMTNHEEELKMSLFDIFDQTAETIAEAKKKNSDESRKRIEHMRISKDGDYSIRVLPLAPVIGPDGRPVLPMERKGYEYPCKELLCKINAPNTKNKVLYVSVPHIKQIYKDIPNDLVDLYVSLACDKYASDEALCKKLRGNSFEGGLKYTSSRSLYVIDLKERAKGIQILQLSYAQYREIEDRKLAVWQKLNEKNPNTQCPISSPMGGYPLEITRKTEGKASYSFTVDTLSGVEPLTEAEVQALMDAPRLPEVLYRYSRRHLEATITFLEQQDEKFGINIMASEEIEQCIAQIKMALPADDNSHFSLNNDSKDGAGSSVTIEMLWQEYDRIDAEGLTDRSEEGSNLRAMIREFIEDNELNVAISRTTPNYDLLQAIESELNNGAPKAAKEAPATDSHAEEAFGGEEASDDVRTQRNDDTNEPAVRRAPRASRRAR
jgi:hypothetical protein